MKTTKLLPVLALAFAMAFCSCKKNNDASASQHELIIGKWFVQADTSRQFINGVIQNTYVIQGINSPYYQFNADGTGAMKYNIVTPDLSAAFTYAVSNDSVVLNIPKRVGYLGDDIIRYQIAKLSSTSVIFLYELDSTVPGNPSYKEYIYLTK